VRSARAAAARTWKITSLEGEYYTKTGRKMQIFFEFLFGRSLPAAIFFAIKEMAIT